MRQIQEDSVGIVKTDYAYFNSEKDILQLESGEKLKKYTIAYETYGKLNKDKSNVILIFHALSGDAHAAGLFDEMDTKPGWWDMMIGPGKPFDTRQYCVICTNVIGGCKGSTGPSSINPETGESYALSFPQITIRDMIKAQKKLIDYLGINSIFAVVGGSMGGMQALQWLVDYPDTVQSAILLATTARLSAQNIAFHEAGRQAVMADVNWNDGNYYTEKPPIRGLSVARMIAHITYLSTKAMKKKFDRRLQDKNNYSFKFTTDFQVESYLHHQGEQFVQRFDANSYLYITRAMDYFDLTNEDGKLTPVFKDIKSKVCVVSFSTDWLFPTSSSRYIVNALKSNNIDVTFCEIQSMCGHDAFLLEKEKLSKVIKGFLNYVEKV